MHHSITRRLLPLYLATFLNCLIFWYAIEKIFLKSIGFNTQTITLVTIIYTVVMLAVNIPAGILADRWSRKGMLLVATGALLLSCLIGGFSQSFWIYAISASLWGLHFACYAGSDQSIIYDLLIEEQGNAHNYARYYGYLQIIAGSGLVISSLLSTLVTENGSLRATYFASIPFLLLALVVLAKFREPKLHRKEVNGLVGAHIRATFTALIHTRAVYYVMAGIILVSVGSRLLYDFDQLWLIALAVPLRLYGLINATLLSSTSIAGIVAGRLVPKNIITAGLVGLVLAAAAGMLVHSSLVFVLCATVFLGALLLLDISLSKLLHDALPAKVRAGSTSIVSTLGYLAFIPVALIFGLIGNTAGIFTAAWVVLAIAGGLGFSVWRAFANLAK